MKYQYTIAKFTHGTITAITPVKTMNVKIIPDRKAENAENINVRNIVNCSVSFKYSFFRFIMLSSLSFFCFSKKPMLMDMFSMLIIRTIIGVNWYMNEIVCPIAMFRIMNEIKVIIAELIKDITENSLDRKSVV